MSYVYLTEENAKLQKKGGRYLVGRNLEVIMEIPEESLEGLVLIGNIQVSSEAMTSLLQQGIPTTWLSHGGKFFGRLVSTSHVDVFRQQKQVLLQNSDYFLHMSKKIIEAKCHNQMTVLRRYNRRQRLGKVDININKIAACAKGIERAETREQLMGTEGIIAKFYFEALGLLVPEEFSFSVRSKRPPLDPFNSMLSFAYTLLMYEMYTAIENHGLSPYFGFMHSLKNHHPALASDLMEEWRAVIVDSMVLGLINHHEILSEHFCSREDRPGVFLTREGRKIFLQAYEKKLRTVNQYLTGEHSYRKTVGYQVAAFSQSLMAENPDMYVPLRIR